MLAATIVATLAIAIGGNTRIFSVVDGVLLKQLPFGNADRLVTITARQPGGDRSVSAMDFTDYRRHISLLDGWAVWRRRDVALTGSGEPERIVEAEAGRRDRAGW